MLRVIYVTIDHVLTWLHITPKEKVIQELNENNLTKTKVDPFNL